MMEKLNDRLNDFLYKYEDQLTLIFHIAGYALFITGVFMLIGGIGNIDYAVESGEKIELAEETRDYIISVIGLIVTAVSIKLTSIGK